jgi:hypothetical protein
MRIDWDLAGLSTEAGKLDRPVAGHGWKVPEGIELAGDRLSWTWLTSAKEPTYVQPGERLLDEFVKLADRGQGAILAYAKRWGVLGLCPCGVPSTHLQLYAPQGLLHPIRDQHLVHVNPCYPPEDLERTEGGWYWEPLEGWRRYSRKMRAVLNLAVKVRASEPGRPQDWAVLYDAPQQVSDVDAARSLLALKLNTWASFGWRYPLFAWSDTKPIIRPTFAGVFGALTHQLMLATIGTRGLAFCSECGKPYAPRRRVRADQANYCDDPKCKKASRRNASRDYYRRTKRKKASGRKHPATTIGRTKLDR